MAVTLTKVESSNIEAVGYHAGTLHIRFSGGGRYTYYDVPESLHKQMMASESKGRFFREFVSGKYLHKKYDG